MTIRRRAALIGITGLAAVALAACGSSSSSKSTSTPATTTPVAPATSGATTASTVHLSADPKGALKFNVTTLHAKAGKVSVVMANPAGSGVPHGVAVEGHGVDQDGAIVQGGGSSTVTVTLKAGTYDFYCPVPGHKAAGMEGKLIVT
jgi:uncharacterized cupredoxin-like copper-binding protein